MFRLQDELTERVVDALALPLTAREQRTLRQDVPADPKAYEYYLRGNQFSHDGTPPREWAERLYNVRQWTRMESGGHFAASEEPERLARDITTFSAAL